MTEQDAGPADMSTLRISQQVENGLHDLSGLSLVSASGRFWNPSIWTQVTSDNRLFHDLLQAFFSLDTGHRIVLALSPFLDDMELKRTDYCRPSLVNAVLALASIGHLGKSVFASTEQCVEHADAFRRESYQHLTQRADSLADVQALGILSVYEVTKGDDKLAITLSGDCIRLAEQLGFHRDLPSDTVSNASTTMQIFRLVTFLVGYHIDSIFCIVANTPSSLNARQLARLLRHKPVVTEYLFSRVALKVPSMTQAVRDGLCEEIAVIFSWFELSLLIEENLSIFYRSQEPLTQSTILNVHAKYQAWYENLPAELMIKFDSPLRVLLLHCQYYVAILLLFRPFYKVRLIQDSRSPRERCLYAAGMVCDIVDSLSLRNMLPQANPMIFVFYLSITNLHFIVEIPLREAAVHLRRSVRLLKNILTWNPTTCQSLEYLAEVVAEHPIDLDAETTETLEQARKIVRSERLYLAYRAEMRKILIFLHRRVMNVTEGESNLVDRTEETSLSMQERGFAWNSE